MSSLRSLELRAARSAIEPAFESRVRIVGLSTAHGYQLHWLFTNLAESEG
jgi:hypothetical protein